MDEATRSLLNRSMAALADGDRRAFDPVYRTLWPLLVRFITILSGDRMIAEDMAQQAMLKILARVSTFDRSKDAVAWSMTIAGNARGAPTNGRASETARPRPGRRCY